MRNIIICDHCGKKSLMVWDSGGGGVGSQRGTSEGGYVIPENWREFEYDIMDKYALCEDCKKELDIFLNVKVREKLENEK